jgi:hypothetical protein
VLDYRFGADKFTARVTYIDRITHDPNLLYRVVGVKERGLMVIDITYKELMPVVSFIDSKGKSIEDLAIKGSVIYWIEQNPVKIVTIEMINPDNPIIVGITQLEEYQSYSDESTTNRLKIEGDVLKVISNSGGYSRIIAAYDIGEHPYRLKLIPAED